MLCPAVYAPKSPDAAVGCASPDVSPCWTDTPCGAGRRVSGDPNFENTLTCVYDGQGQLVSATTCGYEAHNSYCHSQSSYCAASHRAPWCDGSPLECFHVGMDVTCPGDAGSD